ncbi:Glucan 1,3-beta-glucosidase [Mycena venus]|uniref:Glucan 1,3-beta-glucosidase n=1 Tax=Mycena venus TaxID=2733690 RepID=A0A8H6YWV1_9AGAR|nr:Glucan 1,3-beta-glucosidase [Mycena venus]
MPRIVESLCCALLSVGAMHSSRILFRLLVGIPAALASCAAPPTPSGSATDVFWMDTESLHADGTSPFNPTAGYKVFRNVITDYQAVGDGVHDDTANINAAISAMGRCGEGCNSSTVSPAVIYFPHGKYRITSPVIPYYFTSLIGDYNSKPHLIADPGFNGIAVIDADPYIPGEAGPNGAGVNWWTNQNNFFRSVRNFVIDTSGMPANEYGTGIHWQVGQATSIVNVDFIMNAASGTMHQGIYMENGSGGFMSDLTFTGGAFGMWVSNQQFTIRNVQITNAVSAIYQLWNWGFTWQNIQITNCAVGFDLHTGGLTLATQSAGGVVILDSTIENTGIGVRMDSTQATSLGGSVILDNVAFSGITTANIQDPSGTLLAANVSPVRQWFQGNAYTGTGVRTYERGTFNTPPTKAPALLDSTGNFFSKSRPQYNTYTSSQFISVKSVGGAVGNGVHDDSDAINSFLADNVGCGILFFDSGVYLVSKTIFVPAGAQIVGDMYPTILGSGTAFQDQMTPTPVLRVGDAGDSGILEISELVISTTGGSQGAVGIEWNVNGPNQGDTGMWDVHVRLGGAIGTNVQLAECPTTSTDLTKCATAYIGFHVTGQASGYFENVWVWNADHDLDAPSQGMINAFSARGILSESSVGPVWLVGTASEHHVLFQYSFLNAQNIYAGMIQTETPYFQPTPDPPAPFSINTAIGDPDEIFKDAWGLVITNSANIFVYGAGLYSFFQTYGQACVDTQNCQSNIALIDDKSAAVYIYQLTTTGTVVMLTQTPSIALINATNNIDGYASTATFWGSSSATVPPPYTHPPVNLPQTACTQVEGWVAGWANYALDNYYEALANDPGTGEQTGCGCFPAIAQAWEEPVVMEAVTNWAWASGQIANGGDEGANALASSVFISEELSGSPSETGGDFGGGNDDVLWAALAWMKYYQYYEATVETKLTALLNGAKAFIDDVGATIGDDPCPGGVLWKPASSKTTPAKNTITNALFIQASATYYSITMAVKMHF